MNSRTILLVGVLAIVLIIAIESGTLATSSEAGAPLALTQLSKSQLVQLAQSAGFQGDDANTAAAIALAESGGNPQAYNPEVAAGTPSGLGSVGLWQIYQNAHPEFTGENLYDPQTNANAAFAVYSQAGGSFNPWSTFKNGAYEAYL